MKYLLFDTNIYIDMIINRRMNIKTGLMDTFSSLLDCGEVRLILPDIIKYEVYKHIDSELNMISALIKEPIKSIGQIYWLTGINGDNTDVDKFKKDAIKPLQTLLKIFEKNHSSFCQEVRNQIDIIFTENTIRVIEDKELLNRVFLRRIYKKAPFHNEKKESYADGLIIESLLGIKNYISFNTDDLIYFVSGNYTDFSLDKEHRDTFHEHIQSDLIEAELDNKVLFVTSFSELLGKYLKKEVVNAKLEEEFLHELSQSDTEIIKQYEDTIRVQNGLTPFSAFSNMVEDSIINNKDSRKIIDIFKKINKIYTAFDTHYIFYEELLTSSEIINENGKNIIKKQFNKMFEELNIDEKIKSFNDLSYYLNAEKRSVNFESATLPKYIELSDIPITTSNLNIYELNWVNTKLFPRNGGSQTIYLELNDHSQLIARGRVDISYGYVDIDDSENIGDGYKEEISIDFKEIIEALNDILDELDEYENSHKDKIKYIKENITI